MGVGTATSTRRLVLTRLRQYKGVLRGAESVGSVWAWPPDRNSTTCSLSAAVSHPLVVHSALRRQGRGREVESRATGADLSALRGMGVGGWGGMGCSKKPAEAELIPSQDFKLVNVLHQSESIRVKVNQQLQGLCRKTGPGMTWWAESTACPISRRGKALSVFSFGQQLPVHFPL